MPSLSVQRLSVVVPVLNEEDAIGLFLEKVIPIIQDIDRLEYEIIFVDDGSTDRTSQVLHQVHAANPAVCMVRLSRNFGKEAALTAGLEAATGDAVIPMDVDLQDPPELIARFVQLWREGYDVVYGQRSDRASDTAAKSGSAGLFYSLFNRLSSLKIEPNVGDFRLMSRPALQATLRLRERNRFMKGIFAWVGFQSIGVPYTRPARAVGTSKFNYWKLWNFALDGLTSFSTVPLRVWTYVGGIVAVFSVSYTITIILQTLFFGRDVPGYASLMAVVLMLGAVQLISLGIIGEYLGRLYIESKQRPIYVVREQVGLRPQTESSSPVETLLAYSKAAR
ncbi:glycosyltransferase family 2 protein [Paracoccus aerius]|uniref:Glycosyltransferase family 2 protein n=1 Tax=Paracoccus aerius TaxID=1915382 RepID=A0ABS1S9Q6_9RHOB|nr:glycosyltransferase family 2 protein [Paracoccus aerius]MBL3674246.1 glycosyltransferase family 2 protein [Paracoccus aerius]GHG21997.1 bactoprenol glucosyl transferase [Paracoccus aerius]